jgi:hypothetical protein
MKGAVSDFFNDAEDVLMRYIPDFDSRDFIRSVEKDLNVDIDDQSVFAYSNDKEEGKVGLTDYIYAFLYGASWGTLEILGNALSHSEDINALHEQVNKIRNTDVTEYLDSIFKRKDEVIEMVKSRFIKELVEPLEEKINEIVANRDKREKDIQDTQDKLSRLKEEKSEIEKQFEEIQQLGI